MENDLQPFLPAAKLPACRFASVALLSLMVWATPSWSATLEVVASTAEVHPGETVDISVVISDLGDFAAPSLGTFDLELVYDAGLFDLEAGTTMVTLLLGDEMLGEAIVSVTPGAGVVEVVVVSFLISPDLVATQPASFTLFSGTFFPVGAGDGTFDVAVNQLGDEDGAPLPIDAISPVIVTADSILGIPTLGTWSLGLLALLFGITGAVALRRLS